MAGAPLAALEHGLQVFAQELRKNTLACRRVEVAVVTFGAAVEVRQDFVTAGQFVPPSLTARGETPLGSAILRALDLVQTRKACYQANGVAYFRPWVFLITDGMPQGEPLEVVRQCLERIKCVEAGRQAAFFAVAVEGANLQLLTRITVRPVLKLVDLRFADLFTWLSRSASQQAQGGELSQCSLPPLAWEIPSGENLSSQASLCVYGHES
jgi:uncharacterized protein YegL